MDAGASLKWEFDVRRGVRGDKNFKRDAHATSYSAGAAINAVAAAVVDPPVVATVEAPSSTEELLDLWVEAKRAKQFAKADELREELRAQGIEPVKARPAFGFPGHQAGQSNASLQPQNRSIESEAKLGEWVLAKREKDYVTADRLRKELRAVGVDAEKARPCQAQGVAFPMYDAEYERRLDEWVAARQIKDYGKADRLREELLAVGIEPNKARPTRRSSLPPMPLHILQCMPSYAILHEKACEEAAIANARNNAIAELTKCLRDTGTDTMTALTSEPYNIDYRKSKEPPHPEFLQASVDQMREVPRRFTTLSFVCTACLSFCKWPR